MLGSFYDVKIEELMLIMFYDLICLQFYFQNGRPPPKELQEHCISRINDLFGGHMDGLQLHGEMCI